MVSFSDFRGHRRTDLGADLAAKAVAFANKQEGDDVICLAQLLTEAGSRASLLTLLVSSHRNLAEVLNGPHGFDGEDEDAICKAADLLEGVLAKAPDVVQ